MVTALKKVQLKLLSGILKQLNKVMKKLRGYLEHVIIWVTVLKKITLKLLNGIPKQLNKVIK